MKRPTELWQFVCGLLAMGLAVGAVIANHNRGMGQLEEKVRALEVNQFNIQMNSDKKFDKIEVKMDAMSNDIRQVLINQERKQDKK